ncbi:MAG: F0F1 ATP synthase subunit C [Hyphomicrobiaceae bacterium]|nr:F0F1 ATP synthase subunit C [Hyphomicrobiaceae bacterium]
MAANEIEVARQTAMAGKYIGAGLACLGMAGAGIGLGNLFGQFLSGALRNPSAADSQRGNLLLGFALTEALGIFSLLIALLILFVV